MGLTETDQSSKLYPRLHWVYALRDFIEGHLQQAHSSHRKSPHLSISSFSLTYRGTDQSTLVVRIELPKTSMVISIEDQVVDHC